ncbi:MAG: SsrA-binding protein SmpB [Patescibacteria group bacterium]|nr:SsrA-binding protein SmpB [Patescibacteria group bacterium]
MDWFKNGMLKIMPVLVINKKAQYNYQILEKYKAGIVLQGQEVKSIKAGRISLQGSFVVLKGSEVFLLGAKVPAWQPKNAPADYNPQRSRKLLLQKREIKQLIGKAHQKGLTMVPLKVYTERGKIKLEFAMVKGKRKFDKREKIKKREVEREIRRTMKTR